jgi:hypothetical protein
MSYTVSSNDATTIVGNLAFASGTWAADGTHTTVETIVTGLGELKMAHVSVSHYNATNANGTFMDLSYATNETKNGTSTDGSIGIKSTNGSADSGEWWAIGYIS